MYGDSQDELLFYRITCFSCLQCLVLFVDPAYPRNEYLNEYGSKTCRTGSFEATIE